MGILGHGNHDAGLLGGPICQSGARLMMDREEEIARLLPGIFLVYSFKPVYSPTYQSTTSSGKRTGIAEMAQKFLLLHPRVKSSHDGWASARRSDLESKEAKRISYPYHQCRGLFLFMVVGALCNADRFGADIYEGYHVSRREKWWKDAGRAKRTLEAKDLGLVPWYLGLHSPPPESSLFSSSPVFPPSRVVAESTTRRDTVSENLDT